MRRGVQKCTPIFAGVVNVCLFRSLELIFPMNLSHFGEKALIGDHYEIHFKDSLLYLYQAELQASCRLMCARADAASDAKLDYV